MTQRARKPKVVQQQQQQQQQQQPAERKRRQQQPVEMKKRAARPAAAEGPNVRLRTKTTPPQKMPQRARKPKPPQPKTQRARKPRAPKNFGTLLEAFLPASLPDDDACSSSSADFLGEELDFTACLPSDLEDMGCLVAGSGSEDSDAEDVHHDGFHELDKELVDLVIKMVRGLSTSRHITLMSNWKKLDEVCRILGRPLSIGSGCSGSGMDGKGHNIMAMALNKITGCSVQFLNRFEVDYCKTKRKWLQQFSQPQHLFGDVGELEQGQFIHDYMCDDLREFDGVGLWSYSYGFSCKDLSSQNNASASWKDNCLEEECGSSGVSWAGNYNMVKNCQPLQVTIENVPRIVKTSNMGFLIKQLEEAGYEVTYSIRYSDDYGLPQHRGRMWCHARLRQFTSPGWAVAYQDGMDEMAVGATIPLEKCLLTDDSSYLLSHHRHEQARAQRSTEKRLKWKTDHWVARRNESLMPPLLKHMPKKIEDISQSSKILDRELDFVRFLHQKGISIQQVALNRPAMELKH